MKVKYFLRGQQKKQTIILRISQGSGQRIEIALPYKVVSEHWDVKQERVKIKNINSVAINDNLNTLQNEIVTYYNERTAAGNIPSLEQYKRLVSNHLNPKQSSGSDLLDFFTEYIQANKTRISTTTNRPLTIQTQRKFMQLRGLVEDFGRYVGERFTFADLDSDFYNAFVSFLTTEKQYKPNNIGKYINAFKCLLNDATEKEINSNMKYKKWRVITEEVEEIALTLEEVKQIEEAALPEKLEATRQVFLLGCYTGQRFSDYSTFTQSNINYDSNTISLRQQKTDNIVTIPILKQEVIQWIKNKPNKIVEQVFNRNLKEVCKLAGLTQEVCTYETKAGIKQKHTQPKWALVSSHTARRTFVTMFIELGANYEYIRQITGHKDITSFQKYIKIDSKKSAEVLKRIFSATTI